MKSITEKSKGRSPEARWRSQNRARSQGQAYKLSFRLTLLNGASRSLLRQVFSPEAPAPPVFATFAAQCKLNMRVWRPLIGALLRQCSCGCCRAPSGAAGYRHIPPRAKVPHGKSLQGPANVVRFDSRIQTERPRTRNG